MERLWIGGDKVSEIKLEEMVKEYLDIMRDIKGLEQRREELRDRILVEMERQQKERIIVDDGMVHVVNRVIMVKKPGYDERYREFILGAEKEGYIGYEIRSILLGGMKGALSKAD